LQDVGTKNLNKKNASILKKFTLNMSRDPGFLISHEFGSICIPIIRRAGDDGIKLNIDDLDKGTSRTKIKNRKENQKKT